MVDSEFSRYLIKYESDGFGYEKCEKAVADRLQLNVKCREETDEWHGSTTLVLFRVNPLEEYVIKYEWGSGACCDTLQGFGEEAACEMIYKIFIEKYPQLRLDGPVFK